MSDNPFNTPYAPTTASASDSLLPSPTERSEADALHQRIDKARGIALEAMNIAASQTAYSQAAQTLARGMGRVVSILEGKS